MTNAEYDNIKQVDMHETDNEDLSMLGVDELYTYRGNTERKDPRDQLEGGN